MQAVQLVRWGAEPELREVPDPQPGPGEVLLRVDAAGICHSDLHLMEWPEGTLPYRLPFTLGHENVGTVVAVGAGVGRPQEGERVLVYGPWGCGACWRCSQGHENLCPHAWDLGRNGGGLGADGGLAEYLLVPSPRLLVPIGDLDPVKAAPLSDAALTPYHAIKRSAHHLRPNASVVVIGVGGLGHVAVQLLRALTASRVIAVDTRPEAVELARRGGAHAALPARDLTAEDLRAETGAEGASLVLDFVGRDETMALAAGVAAVGGEITVVGVGGGTLAYGFGALPLECSIVTPNWGTLPELFEVIALARSGAIEIETETFALEQALEAYHRLARGEILGRGVVCPT